MPDSPVISGVADLPKFYFAEGAPFRLTLTIGAEFSMTGKFVTFGMRARSGTVRRVFGTDSGESNLTIASQVVTLDIATDDETVPAFAGGWTLANVQAKGETEYWVDISASEGSDVLLRLQGQADWVSAGSDIADSSAVVASPSIDVNISSGAVSVSVAVSGGGGTGDVVGPASATDNAIARYNLTTGKLIQNSGITIADGVTGSLSGSNSGDVTLAGTPAYLTLANQVITRNQINLTSASAHVTGTLPVDNGGTGQTSLGAINAADFGSGAAFDNYVLTADGAGGAAWEAAAGGGGASITGTGFAYVRSTGNDSTGVIGNPSLPYLTAQAAWDDGARKFEFGAGSFSITHESDVVSVLEESVFVQGIGKEFCDLSINWSGIDGAVGSTTPFMTAGGNGTQPSKLILQSDGTVALSLSLSGGDGGAGGVGESGTTEVQGGAGSDGGNGGNSPEFDLWYCYLASFACVAGAYGEGGAGGSDGGAGAGGNGTNGQPGSVVGGTFSFCYVPAGYTPDVNDIFIASTNEGTGQLVSEGVKGDISVTNNGTSWNINSNVVSFGSLVQASATKKLIGRKSAAAGNYEECVITDFTSVAGIFSACRDSSFTDSTGVLSNVTGLSCSVAANEKVFIEVVGFHNGSISGEGMKIAFTSTQSPVDVRYGFEHWTSTSAVRAVAAATSFGTTLSELSGSADSLPFRCVLTMTNGANAATVQFQAASESASTSITISRGATMSIYRIA